MKNAKFDETIFERLPDEIASKMGDMIYLEFLLANKMQEINSIEEGKVSPLKNEKAEGFLKEKLLE